MLSLPQLSEAVSAELLANDGIAADVMIRRVASVQNADAASVVFAESDVALQEALTSGAAVIFTTPKLAAQNPSVRKPLLLVAQPRLAFAQAAILLRAVQPVSGVDATAIVPASTKLGQGVSIGPFTVLGESVSIGAGTRIGAGCVIADGVVLGEKCTIYPRVVIYSGVVLGANVTVHAGCVLGSDGFGYVRDSKSGAYTQFPQQGTLFIEDDVEIGANTTVDRGALEETRIERGTKLDNLVHVGHNVRVGRNVVMAAQTGISGSSVIGPGAVLGGQVGVGEHADIGPDVVLGGGAGVLSKKKLRGPGMVFWGRPAQPLREYLKGLAIVARLARRAKSS